MSRNIKNKITGSLVNLTTYDPVTGEITGFNPVGNVDLGPVENVTITGGTAGQFLQTDGLGNLSWATANGGGGGNANPGGANTYVQYNDAGSFGGSAAFTFNKTTNTISTTNLTVPGNVNFSTADLVNLGVIANLKILGGSSGEVLSTDGTGNLTWTQSGTGTSISNGASNLRVTTFNGNITAAIGGVDGIFTISGDGLTVKGDILPQANVTYDLGSPTRQWKDLYLSSNTLYMGNVPITVSGNVLSVNNNPVITTGTPITGNITTNGTVSGNTISGNTVSANALTSNSLVVSNNISTDSILAFGNTTTSNLVVSRRANLGSVSNVTILGGLSGQVLTTNGSGNLSWAALSVDSLSNGTSNVSIPVANGNINFSVNGVSGLVTIGTAGVTMFGNANVTGNLNTPNVISNVVTSNSFVLRNNSVILGNVAGTINRGTNVVAIGSYAGSESSGNYSVYIGQYAGYYNTGTVGDNTVGVGANAGAYNQSNGAVAIGAQSGTYQQGEGAISIGQFAGGGTNGQPSTWQKQYSVAIGSRAGTFGLGAYSVAIGANAAFPDASANNIIALNATGTSLAAATANAFYVKPVRNATGNSLTYYNTATGEISYSDTGEIKGVSATITGNISGNNLTIGNIVASGALNVSGNISGGATLLIDNEVYSPNARFINLQSNEANVTGNLVAANIDVDAILVGNGTVTGDWTVNGNLIAINQKSLTIEQPIIALGVMANNSPLVTNDGKDRGTLTHTFGANLVTSIANVIAGNAVQLAATGSNALIGQPFYSNIDGGNSTGIQSWPTDTVVTAYDEANNVVTLSQSNIANITPVIGDTVVFGSDDLQFIGYLPGSNLFVAASNVSNVENTITVNEYGNFRAAEFRGTGANITGNIIASQKITASDANILQDLTVTRNANISGRLTVANANVTGDLRVDNNLIVGGGEEVTGNIEAGNVIAVNEVSGQTGRITANLNVGGNIISDNQIIANDAIISNTVTANFFTGTLTTNSQPNITSVGTLLSLDVSGNTTLNSANMVTLEVTAFSSLGDVGNVAILGGESSQVLVTDGTGNLSWANTVSKIVAGNNISITPVEGTGEVVIEASGGGSGSPGGPNLSVQFNNGGNLDGVAGVKMEPTAGRLTANELFENSVRVINITTGMPYYVPDGVVMQLPDYQVGFYMVDDLIGGPLVIDGTFIIDGKFLQINSIVS